MTDLEQEIVRRMSIKLRGWAWRELFGPDHGPGLIAGLKVEVDKYAEARERLGDV